MQDDTALALSSSHQKLRPTEAELMRWGVRTTHLSLAWLDRRDQPDRGGAGTTQYIGNNLCCRYVPGTSQFLPKAWDHQVFPYQSMNRQVVKWLTESQWELVVLHQYPAWTAVAWRKASDNDIVVELQVAWLLRAHWGEVRVPLRWEWCLKLKAGHLDGDADWQSTLYQELKTAWQKSGNQQWQSGAELEQFCAGLALESSARFEFFDVSHKLLRLTDDLAAACRIAVPPDVSLQQSSLADRQARLAPMVAANSIAGASLVTNTQGQAIWWPVPQAWGLRPFFRL